MAAVTLSVRTMAVNPANVVHISGLFSERQTMTVNNSLCTAASSPQKKGEGVVVCRLTEQQI